jgi:hypothetical protein
LDENENGKKLMNCYVITLIFELSVKFMQNNKLYRFNKGKTVSLDCPVRSIRSFRKVPASIFGHRMGFSLMLRGQTNQPCGKSTK